MLRFAVPLLGAALPAILMPGPASAETVVVLYVARS
jgi:hypothetical protein